MSESSDNTGQESEERRRQWFDGHLVLTKLNTDRCLDMEDARWSIASVKKENLWPGGNVKSIQTFLNPAIINFDFLRIFIN